MTPYQGLLLYMMIISLGLATVVYLIMPDASQPDPTNTLALSDFTAAHPEDYYMDPDPVIETHVPIVDTEYTTPFSLPPGFAQIEQGPWPDRVAFVRELSFDLEIAECEQLISWLRQPMNDREVNDGGHVIRNEVMSALRRQEKINHRLTDAFIGMAYDDKLDDTMRGYAVQHLSSWYEEWDNPHHRACIRAGMWDFVGDRGQVHGGTALLALWRMTFVSGEIDRAAVADVARVYAESDDTLEENRVAGLQVCAELNVQAALPAAIRHRNFSKHYTTRLTASRAVKKMTEHQIAGSRL